MRGCCGISFLGDLTVSATVELAERAEELGVQNLWMSETYFERDAWTTLCAMALRTRRVTLGTGVVPVFMRHPTLLAMSFATLDELSKGRVIAGIGAGVGNVVSAQLSLDYTSPLSAMREAIAIMRAMFRDEDLDLDGRVFSARNVRLAGLQVGRDIPIHAAAMGPKMCALAGEVADGVHYCMPTPTLLEESNRQVVSGIQRAGRESDAVERVAWVISAVHEDAQVARNVAREHIAVALSTAVGRFLLEREGLDPGMAGVLRDAVAKEGYTRAATRVNDEAVDVFSAAGTAAQVTEKVEALLDAGVTHPVLTAYGPHAANVLAVAARFQHED